MSFARKKCEEPGGADFATNHSATTPESVTSIVLSIWSPKDIVTGSVLEVTQPDTYENHLPKPNGLFDARMGVIENGQVCETCKQNNHNCTGHFGHITLAKPVYYMQMLQIVLKVLKCVCWRCSKCLLKEEDKKKIVEGKTKFKARFATVLGKCQSYQKTGAKAAPNLCDFCNAAQPKYSLKKDKQSKTNGGLTNIFYNKETKMSVENVLLILKRITDEEVELIGLSPKYSRPDWMICTVLPVPPPHVRPSVRQDGNQKAEDDLTHKLTDIVKSNNTLRQKITALSPAEGDVRKKELEKIEECYGFLQYHVATLMDNEMPGVLPASQRGSGRPLKSLKQRLSAKEGRMRNNLMGKRCNFTARSVISPDANIALDELGVPLSIATNLTYPVTVTKLNLAELTVYVKNRDTYPGAKSVVKAASGRRYCLAYAPKELKLECGDVVNRHMMDGDVVLFNRQPSLHKMSMMGHRVRVLPYGMTFRLNLSVTTPYNADFDGDEMNAHLPQSCQTQAELKYLTLVPSQLISPQKSAPVMGIVQDSLLAANLMTKAGSIALNAREVCRLLMWNDAFNGNIGGDVWSGQRLFAQLLPEIINLKRTNTQTAITSYHQMTGMLDKSILGSSAGGLIHILFKDYGEQVAADFMYATQRLVNNWLLINGFSVGMSDCLVPANDITIVTAQQTEEVMTIGEYTQEIIADVQTKVLATLQDSYDSPEADLEELETKIKQQLNTGRDLIGKVILNDTTPNRLTDIIKAESKGNVLNIAQIRGCLGQSEVEGKRAPLNMDRRSLPFYARDDDSAAARGFIANSFLTGITPQEYVFHAIAGRIGIIDTAIRTSETGYIQRRLIKTMEDVSVSPDHTVRDAMGNIVEFQYGEDGYDACRLESISKDAFDFHTISTAEFNNRFVHQFERLYWETYLMSHNTLTVYGSETLATVQAALEEEYAVLVKCKEEFRRKISVFEERLSSPIHLERVIKNVQAKHGAAGAGAGAGAATGFVQLSPYTTYSMVKAQIIKMKNVVVTQSQSAVSRNRGTHTLFILETLMRVCLHSKEVMTTLQLSREALAEVLHECYKMFLRGLVNPGEMVGIIASQSIGEPATQMCVDGAEVVTVWNATTRQCYHGPIGPWLDELLRQKAATNVQLGERFVANNLDEDDDEDEMYIHAVSMSSEKMPRPYRIRQISRLPANGKMMKITTRTGRTVTATMSHAFLRRLTSGMEKVSGHDLRVGDRIPVACHLPVFEPAAAAAAAAAFDPQPLPLPLNELFGSLVGLFLSGGHLDENSTKVTLRNVPMAVAINTVDMLGAAVTPLLVPNDSSLLHVLIIDYPGLAQWLRAETGFGSRSLRRVPQCMFEAPLSCVAALLRGYLDGDGTDAVEKHTIRCCSTSAALLDDISLLLAYFDILPYKFKGAAGSLCLHHMAICTKYADAYVSRIGSNVASKLAALRDIVAHNHRDDRKSHMEFMDKIPKLGSLLTQMCKRAGFNRSCQQWATRESIGRRTLLKYIELFEAQGSAAESDNVQILRQAHDSDVVWDKIMRIEIIPEDVTKLVYDLSVEGAETFMLGSGILVHNTLNTFHNTGVSAKSQTTTGVPRLKELLNISKNPKTPSLDIMLQPAYAQDEDSAMKVGHLIAITSVKDLLATSFLQMQTIPMLATATAAPIIKEDPRQQCIEDLFATLRADNPKRGKSYLMVCLEFKKGHVLNRQLDMATIQKKMEQQSESSKVITMEECITADENSNCLLCLCLFDLAHNTVQDVRHWYKHVGEITICGKSKIHQAYPMECLKKYLPFAAEEDGSFKPKKAGSEYMLRTDGSNLEDIINMAEIDATRTVSNNVNEIYQLFGIEAARQALMEEFINTLSQTSAYVNYRHICLLADVMTNKGVLLSIDIHGVKKGDIGPLARASFEETVDQLVKSACYAEKDKMSGVSANIMLGQVPPTGTGTVKLLFDERKMKAQMPVVGCDIDAHFAFDFKPIVKSTLLPPLPKKKL